MVNFQVIRPIISLLNPASHCYHHNAMYSKRLYKPIHNNVLPRLSFCVLTFPCCVLMSPWLGGTARLILSLGHGIELLILRIDTCFVAFLLSLFLQITSHTDQAIIFLIAKFFATGSQRSIFFIYCHIVSIVCLLALDDNRQ